jgi:hypothetical protein
VVSLVMAWSPFQRANAGIVRVTQPGDYANPIPTTSAPGPPKNQKTLSWLGGSAVVVIAGLWTAFVYFFPPKKDEESPGPQVKIDASVKAGNCGIANSGTVTSNTVNCGSSPPAAPSPKP